MTDIEPQHSFTRFYKYKNKVEESPFFTRYVLAPECKLVSSKENTLISKEDKEVKVQVQKIEHKQEKLQDQLKQQGDEDKNEVVQEFQEQVEDVGQVKKQDKRVKINYHQERRKVEMTMEQVQQMKTYGKVNLKNIKIVEKRQNKRQQESTHPSQKKKKKFVKMEERKQEWKLEMSEAKQINNRPFKNNEKKQSRHRIYAPYKTLQEIQSSRKNGQKKYYKGRIQFGQGPKNRGKIISEQLQGLFFIQGRHCNRALHDDKVYFEVIHQETERSFCKVVYIFEQKREVVGRVEFIFSKNIFVLHPINSRIASMNVVPESASSQVKQFKNTHYFRAEYLGWNDDLQYPTCKLIDKFGQFGQIEVQTSALLKTHFIQDIEYDNDLVKKDLNKFLERINQKGEYVIPEQEISKREDLRTARIFTIDPLNARDFDDALSITQLGDIYEVGVHIADASFFCEEGSMVDSQAQKRTTSVYLVHRVIPMLPRILCQNLCSLNPACQRLTFSLWIKLDKYGNVIDEPRLSRSVIKSVARFTYDQAQHIIEGKIKSQKQIDQGFGCVNSQDFKDVADDIIKMDTLAKQIRKRRVERGSLFFEIPKKVFKLDQFSYPLQFKIYQRKEAHFLVQEYMILANELVGDLLVNNIKDKSLLRRHKYPGPKKIARFEQFMKKAGVPLTLTSTSRVQDEINKVIDTKTFKQSIKDIVRYQTVGLLQAADYFLIGKSQQKTWIHYALNAPVYTHFTSPIRRYPDILVHRQLASILEQKFENSKIPGDLIDRCNEKKLMSKRVSNGCEKIFMCLYLKKNKVIAKGIIVQAESWGIKVCVPSFDFKGNMRISEVKDLEILSAQEDLQKRKILRMKYKADVETKFILKEYQEIDVRLSCNEAFPLDYRISIIMPHPEHLGQHLVIG